MGIKYKLELVIPNGLNEDTYVVSKTRIESSLHESIEECIDVIKNAIREKAPNRAYCFYITEIEDFENIPLKKYLYDFKGMLIDREIYTDKEKSLENFKNLSADRKFFRGALIHFICEGKIYQGIVHEHYWMVNGKAKKYEETNIDEIEGPEIYTVMVLKHQDGLSIFHVNRMDIIMDYRYNDYGNKVADLYRPIREYLDSAGYPKEEPGIRKAGIRN